MKRQNQVALAAFLTISIWVTGNAQTPNPAQAGVNSVPQPKPRQPVVMKVRGVSAGSVGMGERLSVYIDNLQDAMRQDSIDPAKLILYLDGHPLWNVHGQLLNADSGRVEFRLERADTSQEAWVTLLGRPRSLEKQGVAVGVGYGSAPELGTAGQIPHIALTVAGSWELFAVILLMLVFVVGFLSLAWRSNIIRDASPPFPPKGSNKPYSLSRFQMSVWFFLVFGAFVFLALITHSLDVLNQQALMLIGIGTGTALGAAVVDNSKQSARESKIGDLTPERARLQAEIAELQNVTQQSHRADAPGADAPNLPSVQIAEKSAKLTEIEDQIQQLEQSRIAPVSAGFLNDILTDSGGISLHRFQMVAWTIILGLFFVYAVWDRLAMPEFSPTLLALMGISAGTYLGFKVPEKVDQ
jgi:hypothetical protein